MRKQAQIWWEIYFGGFIIEGIFGGIYFCRWPNEIA